jgi:predicted RNase H-like HicB family nuclease
MREGKMARTPDEILKAPYARVLTPADDGTYTAEILEFPGCISEGDTAQEALANLHEAAVLWLEDVLEQRMAVPEPVALEEFAGKIALRLPRSLHRKCVLLAEKESVSLNQFLVAAISARVGAEDLYKRILDTLEERLEPATQNYFVQLDSSAQGVIGDVSRGNTSGFVEVPTGARFLNDPISIKIVNSERSYRH